MDGWMDGLFAQVAVFGKTKEGQPNNNLRFAANNLVVTNVDVQSVEPVEQRTRDALQKSVQLAIEISTSSQEALANHEVRVRARVRVRVRCGTARCILALADRHKMANKLQQTDWSTDRLAG